MFQNFLQVFLTLKTWRVGSDTHKERYHKFLWELMVSCLPVLYFETSMVSIWWISKFTTWPRGKKSWLSWVTTPIVLEYFHERTTFSSFISSVRSSSGYNGLIEIRSSNPLFQIFQILQILKWKWKWKDPTCAIFLKSMGFKDIENDIPVYQM